MKLLVVLLLAGLVVAMPRKGNRPNKPKQDDPGMIIRCMAENWNGGESQIKACRKCFRQVGNPLSEKGLPKAKACTSQYLPIEDKACATKIAALTVGDEQKGEDVIKCFDDSLEKANNDRCLKESQSTDVVDKLTDGSMCVIDSWKYGMDYLKNVTRSERGKGKGKRPGKGKGKGGKKMVGKMLLKAHCNLASGGDQSKTQDCETCFVTAIKLGKGKGKGGKGKKELSPEMKAALTTCSEEHLTPKYDHCTAMFKDSSSDKKVTEKCYMKVLIKDVVSRCSAGVAEATADTLTTVMECGRKATIEWVKNNASEKVAEQIGNFLEDDDDEDEEF